ncbi:hypothetical protein PUN28_016092 [Cardiocondyla obscurior]|uniref:Uncharacterized protein n=1 Tax=Cardiocondyla obscurior TaxID=286306 RepID=A0AAW2ETD0_9HYME
MDSAAILVLFALLIAFVGNAAASCKQVANEDMEEYFCEGGHPDDLITVPITTMKLRILKMPLGRISADTFARFGENLWVLSCSHCELTDIDANAFRRLVNLQQLSLDSNHLTTVKASWFEGLNLLTFLDLNYNDIRDIEDDVYKNLPGLVDFRISGNRLRCLNLAEMTHLTELKRMFLSENSEFACPHAVSKFLEDRGVGFEQDPEWRRLASDIIDVHVPPTYVEENREIEPPYHVLHSDRKPPLEDAEGPFATRDRTFYPNHVETYRSRHRKPSTTTARPTTSKQEGLPVPRVEPMYPNTRPLEPLPPHQMSYPYSTLETPRVPPSDYIESSELHARLPTILPPLPRPMYETTPLPISPVIPIKPNDIWSVSTGKPQQMEEVLINPPRETILYPTYPYPTERSRVVTTEALDETAGESGRSSQSTVTYPLYATTSVGLDRTSQGSIRVTYPSLDESDVIDKTFPTMGKRPLKPHLDMHDPQKMIVEESLSETENDVFVATSRPGESDQSRGTTSGVHYVRPSPPDLIYSPATGEFSQPPYYESTVTVHPPLQNYQENVTVIRPLTTTNKPDCPQNSASKIQPAAALVTLIVIAMLGHAAVEEI